MREIADMDRINKEILDEIKPICLDDKQTQTKVYEEVECLIMTGERLGRLGDIFRSEMDKGLHEEPSSLLMQNTYIPQLPNGFEEGEFMALDLGGTNFRVVGMTLLKGRVVREIIRKYDISSELRIGCGIKLFDFLASCLADYMSHSPFPTNGHKIPLGFTFSFPMKQRAIDVGVLDTWTKSFIASSVEGNDVVQMLRDALARRGDTNINVVAVLNDTTGTLVHGASIDRDTRIGLVLGTGSNACYMESADRVTHWVNHKESDKEVIINIEWGALGDNGLLDFIKTEFDREVDRNSLIVSSFTFEKYISGKYLGEIVRNVLVHLANHGLLFKGQDLSTKLQTPNLFFTNYVSLIELDTISMKTVETERVLKIFDMAYSQDDLQIIKMVCEIVSLRAALLVSACLSVLLKRINKDKVTVAVDGSLFKHHPRFKYWMDKFIPLLAPDYMFELMLAEDGSAKGAALTAAIALRLKQSK